MTPYVGCDRARELLDGLVDGELSMPDQLEVESHLRWCETCALRVDDMRLIGNSLRAQSPARPLQDATTATLDVVNGGLLVRVRAERAQSWRSRLREMFTDQRFVWPALGATAAVLLCVAATFSVLHASTSVTPDSLAGMMSAMSPGSERNPLRPADNGISIPRLSEDEGERLGGTLEQLPADDAFYTFRTVVSRDGSVAAFAILLSDDNGVGKRTPATQDQTMADAVRTARFTPALTPMGQAVAVDMVWMFAKTTVVGPLDTPRSRPTPSDTRAKDTAKPVPQPPGVPVSGSAVPRRSATA